MESFCCVFSLEDGAYITGALDIVYILVGLLRMPDCIMKFKQSGSESPYFDNEFIFHFPLPLNHLLPFGIVSITIGIVLAISAFLLIYGVSKGVLGFIRFWLSMNILWILYSLVQGIILVILKELPVRQLMFISAAMSTFLPLVRSYFGLCVLSLYTNMRLAEND